MSETFTRIFSKIPQDQINIAIQCGVLLGIASSIFYLFFGRLLSIPELIGVTLKKPTSSSSRNSIVVIAGFVFLSAILRTFYHQHISGYYPFDDQVYLRKISTLRLIISGALVGVGSQMALNGRQNTGVMGVHNFSFASIVSFLSFFLATMLTVTYRLSEMIPKTPKVIEIANNALPKNISFDAYLLVTLLTPFVAFLISKKKTLKGMIQFLAHFIIGILLATFLMILDWSSIQNTYKRFSYSKKWTGQMIVAFAIATLILAVFYLIVKYGIKKPLFSNALCDKKVPLTFKNFIGYILAGIGFGLGGMLFESFLLTVPSSQIRIAVFWGVPCIFSIKAVQVLFDQSSPSDKNKQQEKKQ